MLTTAVPQLGPFTLKLAQQLLLHNVPPTHSALYAAAHSEPPEMETKPALPRIGVESRRVRQSAHVQRNCFSKLLLQAKLKCSRNVKANKWRCLPRRGGGTGTHRRTLWWTRQDKHLLHFLFLCHSLHLLPFHCASILLLRSALSLFSSLSENRGMK